MNKSINISLDRKRTRHLQGIALRYGLSLNELATRILEEITNEIPEESVSDYRNSRSFTMSINRALADVQHGRVSTKL